MQVQRCTLVQQGLASAGIKVGRRQAQQAIISVQLQLQMGACASSAGVAGDRDWPEHFDDGGWRR